MLHFRIAVAAAVAERRPHSFVLAGRWVCGPGKRANGSGSANIYVATFATRETFPHFFVHSLHPCCWPGGQRTTANIQFQNSKTNLCLTIKLNSYANFYSLASTSNGERKKRALARKLRYNEQKKPQKKWERKWEVKWMRISTGDLKGITCGSGGHQAKVQKKMCKQTQVAHLDKQGLGMNKFVGLAPPYTARHCIPGEYPNPSDRDEHFGWEMANSQDDKFTKWRIRACVEAVCERARGLTAKCWHILYRNLMWACIKMKFHSSDRMCVWHAAECWVLSPAPHGYTAFDATKATWGNYCLFIELQIK